jgi:DNA/RNA-binding domain of Phe-tRNA-synthetase-like protein
MEISLSPELHGKARLGVLLLSGVTVRASDEALAAEIERYAAELRARHSGAPSAEVPGAADARTLYKQLGLDPTKTRPSSEALLRRVLKGEPLYRINTLVDALNLCSLRAQLPFGLYDRSRIEPPVALRRGRAGESYEGIRKGDVNVEGRPVLADGQGPFGNPSSDSARTMVRLETSEALVTVYAPATFATARLERILDDTSSTLTRFCGGAVVERRLLQ